MSTLLWDILEPDLEILELDSDNSVCKVMTHRTFVTTLVILFQLMYQYWKLH